MQKLSKYKLIFTDYFQNTETKHIDYNNITDTLNVIKEINTENDLRMGEFIK